MNESLAAEYSTLHPLCSRSVQSHLNMKLKTHDKIDAPRLSSPWSNCMWCLASEGGVAYFLITLSSISAEPRKREKQPGEQRTQPRTCSVAFCSQWPTAYSNF